MWNEDVHISNLGLEICQLLLDGRIFLAHLLILGLPLITLALEGLDLALEVAGFDVGLAESICTVSMGNENEDMERSEAEDLKARSHERKSGDG